MSNLFLNTNFVNNSGYVNKVGHYNSRAIAFKGVQKDEFVRSTTDKKDKTEKVSNLEKGVKLYEDGDFEACIETLACSIEESDKPSARAFHCKGSAERILGRYDEAIDDYTKALEIVPNSTNTIRLRGRSHYLKAVNNHLTGEAFKTAIASAIADFDAAIEKNPEDFEAMKYKAEAFMATGDYMQAVRMLDCAVDVLEDKLANGTELSKSEIFMLADMHHINGNCLTLLAETTGNAGYYGEAADEYADAYELYPESTNSLRMLGKSYYEYATKAGLKGEEFSDAIDASVANLDQLLEIKFDPQGLKIKADALMAKGSWEEAETALDALIGYEKKQLRVMKKSGSQDKAKMDKIHFSIGNSHHLKGSCLRRQGKYDEAVSEYTTALNYVPKSPNTMKMKGRSLYQKALTKDITETEKNSLLRNSIEEYDKAIAMRPEGELYKFKAESLMKLRDFNSALDAIALGVELETKELAKLEGKTNSGKLNKKQIALANLYATEGDCHMQSATNSHSIAYPKAVEAYTKAIELVDDSPNLYYARACANYHVNGEDCQKDIRKAIELDPSRPEYWSYLSKSLAYSDNEDEVQESFDAMLTAMALRDGWKFGGQQEAV